MNEQNGPGTGMVPAVSMSIVSADQYGFIEARIRADAQVRTMLALARPRDLDVVREKLLKDAARPGFAEAAEYSMPRGKKKNERGEWVQNYIEGPTIRFAEAALRALGNVLVDVAVTHETDDVRAGEVTVVDLESNQTYRQGFVVAKTIERRKLAPGTSNEDILRTRLNSEGQTLYIVRASDADVLMMQGAITSRIIRNLSLRLTPGDIVEEAQEKCYRTRQDRDAQDPAAARKRLADAFSTLNVNVGDLKAYLGHALDQCSPVELDSLRKLHTAIKEGATTWAEVAGVKAAEEAKPDPTAEAARKVRDSLAKKAEVMADPKPPEAPKTGPFPPVEAKEGEVLETTRMREPGEDPDDLLS